MLTVEDKIPSKWTCCLLVWSDCRQAIGWCPSSRKRFPCNRSYEMESSTSSNAADKPNVSRRPSEVTLLWSAALSIENSSFRRMMRFETRLMFRQQTLLFQVICAFLLHQSLYDLRHVRHVRYGSVATDVTRVQPRLSYYWWQDGRLLRTRKVSLEKRLVAHSSFEWWQFGLTFFEFARVGIGSREHDFDL